VTRDDYGKAYEKGFHCTVRFLMSRGVHRDLANEVAQSAWARGWERLSQLRDDSLVTTWVNSIALNLRRASLRGERLLPVLPDNGVTIDLAAIDMAQILQRCRPRDQALLLQSIHGFTAAEIAHQEHVTQTAVRIRLLRARHAARAQLNRTAPLPKIRALAMAG
jgi:DNA-directed RNA polymerase specialized sigma24 family protein